MDFSELEQTLKSVEVAVTDPAFYSRVFHAIARQEHQRLRATFPELADLLGREYLDLSDRLKRTGIQEGCSVRNTLRTRLLAAFLIDEQGEFSEEKLAWIEEMLTARLYPIGPDRQHDAKRQESILATIRFLRQRRDLRAQIMRITKPTNHKLLEQVIRDTLQLPPGEAITDTHARRAALAAWLCYLRQNVGSCFATAPCIIIHNEQPQQFLRDIEELLGTGRLKRTFGGVEYTAPVSSTWGAGDLRRRLGLWHSADDPSNNIWEAPGVIAAFRAVGLIGSDIPPEGEIQVAKKIIEHLLEIWESEKAYVITSVEEIFRKAILVHHQLTEQDIKDFQNRPKPMLQDNLMIQVTHLSKATTSKNERCELALSQMDIAGNTFKALAENALLRTWEFTVASFAETKANFSKWNLYSSLGLGANEPGGIGNCLYQILQGRLDETNREVQKQQEEYEAQYQNIKYLEQRIRRATTEQELKFLNIEYQTRRNEFYTVEVLRNKAHDKAQRYANLFSVIIDKYLELFPNYFQEVYDADLHEVESGPYDDSPAGFRLLFKHGRPNTAVWTRIYNPAQYVEALASFFTMTEPILSSSPEFEGLTEDLGQMITAIVIHVKTPQFIESALYRMAESKGGRFVKNPLEHLELLEKKPWAYTSGGNMETLISCYYRSDKHTTNERWVESPIELAVFLLDLTKKLPPSVSEEYVNNPSKALLIHSPTHAFLFKPGLSLFRKGVLDKTFTYTWVRDQIFLPAKRFVTEQYLDRDLIRHIVKTLRQEVVPEDFKDAYDNVFYSVPGRLSALELRDYLLKEVSRSPKLQRYGTPLLSQDDMDSFLYKTLPVARGYDLANRVNAIIDRLASLKQSEREQLKALFIELERQAPSIEAFTAEQLQNVVKALLCLLKGSSTRINFHREVAEAAQELGFAMPAPLIFADTNWVTDYFALTVNPGNANFELWRVDETGSQGAPMSHWRQWLDGSRRTPTWGVFTNPTEYRA